MKRNSKPTTMKAEVMFDQNLRAGNIAKTPSRYFIERCINPVTQSGMTTRPRLLPDLCNGHWGGLSYHAAARLDLALGGASKHNNHTSYESRSTPDEEGDEIASRPLSQKAKEYRSDKRHPSGYQGAGAADLAEALSPKKIANQDTGRRNTVPVANAVKEHVGQQPPLVGGHGKAHDPDASPHLAHAVADARMYNVAKNS